MCKPLMSVLLVLVCGVATAGAQGGPRGGAEGGGKGEVDLLQPRRWTEIGYGLSLRPPVGAKVLPPTTDGALITFLEPGVYELDVRILETQQRSTPEDLKKVAEEQLGAAFQTAVVAREEPMRVASKPAFAQYLKIPNREEGDWVLAQVFVQIDPVTFAVLRLTVEEKDLARVLPLFQAVVEDASVMDYKELDRIRTAQFEAGEAMLKATPAQRWQRALPEQAWWRIQDGHGQRGRHVGWAMWRLGRREAMGDQGLSFSQTMQLRSGDARWDTLIHAFENDRGDYEMWEGKVTRRADAAAAPEAAGVRGGTAARGAGGGARGGAGERREGGVGVAAQAAAAAAAEAEAMALQTWVETGVRTEGILAVAQESPRRRDLVQLGPRDPAGLRRAPKGDFHRWPVPPGPYVSQARASLLPFIVPGDREADYAFYAYDPGSANLVMRTLRVRPMGEGGEGGEGAERGYLVYIRPSPTRAEQVLAFDARGRPLYHDLPDGRRWVPTTPEVLRRLEEAEAK